MIPHNWIIEENVGSDHLLITVGDSWTWGAHLCGSDFVNPNPGKFFDDREYRARNVYGYHLHKLTNYDWINLAICGVDNISMIDHCWKFLKTLKKSYKKIHIILTLTEIGRELTGRNFLLQKDHYESLQGPDWPNFLDLVNQKTSDDKINLFRKECFDSELEILYSYDLYQSITGSKSIAELLERYEKYTFDLAAKLLLRDNVSCTVGRNYVDNFVNNTNITNLKFTNKKWTDVIAENGGLQPYPQGIRFLGGIAIRPVTEYVNQHCIGTKQEMLELLDLTSQGIDWLDNSPFNSNLQSSYKHPRAIAHQWWAEYLYNHVDW
jgi:hypothetical protein